MYIYICVCTCVYIGSDEGHEQCARGQGRRGRYAAYIHYIYCVCMYICIHYIHMYICIHIYTHTQAAAAKGMNVLEGKGDEEDTLLARTIYVYDTSLFPFRAFFFVFLFFFVLNGACMTSFTSPCMHVCVYVCMCAHHVCVCVCMCVCLCMHACMYVCEYVYVCVCECVCLCMHACMHACK